jgi:hypothetical protein
LSDVKERTGLGKVVYTTKDDESDSTSEKKRAERAEQAERAEVEVADAESFPASDAPSFAGGKETEES